MVRQKLGTEGTGKVLVIDGGGSTRCALVGDQLAALGVKNGWEGIVVYGCIRDSEDINAINIGIKAMNTCPVKSIKRNEGQEDIVLSFAGVEFNPGHYVYSDTDGTLVSAQLLL